MKTKIIVSTIIYFLALTQLQDQPDNSIIVKVPKNAEKLTRSAALTYLQTNFKTKNIIVTNKNVYKINTVLIGYDYYSPKKGETKTLSQTKKELEGMMAELELEKDVVKSEIVQINNSQYFVWQTLMNGEYVYTIFSDTNNKKALVAKILFKKDDKKNGDRIFDDIVKGITLKK